MNRWMDGWNTGLDRQHDEWNNGDGWISGWIDERMDA